MRNSTERPAPLTAAERAEVVQHPRVGHAMLCGSGLQSFDLAADIALTHHERFDGSGYPQGLSGSQIPLEGRIVAVADAFDALTTDRPYRPAGTVEDAVVELTAGRGGQFDPNVLDAFLDNLDDAVRVLEQHPVELVTPLDETYLTLQAAADTLRMSPSRLRRWSDDGRIETHRTAGGHRRFPLAAVRRLADEIGVQPLVRPTDPPRGPVVALAEAVRAHGDAIVATAAKSIYRDGPSGFFAMPTATEALETWVRTLASSCERGDYTATGAATDVLLRHAHLHAATLLERHLFLQRFSHLVLRLMLRSQASSEDLSQARLLFSSIEQHALDGTLTGERSART